MQTNFQASLPEYDDGLASQARHEAFGEQKNDAVRYNPFALTRSLETLDELSKVIEQVNKSRRFEELFPKSTDAEDS